MRMYTEAPPTLYKFGYTTFEDIDTRFALETHYQKGWEGIPLKQDYNVRVMWGAWFPKEVVVEAEEWFRSYFPKEFYCDKKYNGITECRDWSDREYKSFRFKHLEPKYNYPGSKTNRDNHLKRIEELRVAGTLYDTHSKLYLVMLTKK